MLIKLNLNDKEELSKADALKFWTHESTYSKAARVAVLDYVRVSDDLDETKEKLKESECELYQLKELLKEKLSVESQLKRFLN